VPVKPRTLALTLGFLTLAALAATRCGQAKKSDKAKATTPALTTGAAVPAGWDGQGDWSGSAWEVVGE
jgi:hypothetical protein